MIFKKYITATTVQSAGSFIAMALLARILSPVEFGRWVLLEPLVLLGAQLSIFGANMGIIKLVAQDQIPISQAFYSLIQYVRWIFISVIFAFMVGAYVFYSKNVSALYVGFWLASEGLLVLLLSGFRGANEPLVYVISVLIRTGMIISGLLVFWFLGFGGLDVAEDVALWWGICSTVSFVALLIGMNHRQRAKKERLSYLPVAAKNGISYGKPILLAVVLAAVIGNGDRYVLGAFVDQVIVGQYAIYAKISSALNLMVTPMNLWWPTARFKHINDPDGGEVFFSKVTLQMLFFFTFMGSSLWLVGPLVLTWLAPHAVYSSFIVGALIVSALAVAMSLPLSVGLLKEGNTKWIPITLFVSATTQIGLAFVLIPRWGGDGAAGATAIGAIVGLMVQRFVSQRLHRTNLPYFRMLVILSWVLLDAYFVSLLGLPPIFGLLIFGALTMPLMFSCRKVLWPLVN